MQAYIKHTLSPTFDLVKYQDTTVAAMKKAIATNNIPTAMMVSGPSGCGKTLLVRAFVRTLQCSNRKPGEVEPCGKCALCQTDPRTSTLSLNRSWIQEGADGESLNKKVKSTLQEFSKGGNFLLDDHNSYLVMVIDEAQSIDKRTLNQLLLYPELPEVAQRKILIIFVTMDEQAIARKDPELYTAITGRCKLYRLKGLTQQQISEQLTKLHPSLSSVSADYIAMDSNGSMRLAITLLEGAIEQEIENNPPLVAEYLRFANREYRGKLWNLIRHRKSQVYKDLFQLAMDASAYVDPYKLARQLRYDIIHSQISGYITDDQLDCIHVINGFESGYLRGDLYSDLLNPLVGKDLVDLKLFKEKSNE